MSVRFTSWRMFFYVVVLLFSGVVLGIASHLASVFLPHLHPEFTTFALVIPSLTIFVLLVILQWSQPRIECVVLFILFALWLAMGAWSNDIISYVQCDALAGQRTATKNGDMSAQAYCHEMKVIEAFSWINFILFIVAFIMIMVLVSSMQGISHHDVWSEPIQELRWFNELPSQNNHGMMPMQYMPQQGGYVPYGGAQHHTVPGRTLIVQPHHNGQPPTVTEVPYGTAGV